MIKILFLDIDGPMIPGRAYTMAGQTKPVVKTFDPCAVGLLNSLCQNKGWRIVIHSSWLRVFGEQKTYDHCVSEGLKPQYFHKDAWCDGDIHWRYTRVAKWLKDHPDVTKYHILDDEPYKSDLYQNTNLHPIDMSDHLILVDFYDGITKIVMQQIGKGPSSRGQSEA